MERLIDLVFGIGGLFDVRSCDPVLAAFKHARRSAIICTVAQCSFFSLAISFDMDGTAQAGQLSQLTAQVSSMVANGFAMIAVAFLLGMVWFAFKCLHICFKPESYMK